MPLDHILRVFIIIIIYYLFVSDSTKVHNNAKKTKTHKQIYQAQHKAQTCVLI